MSESEFDVKYRQKSKLFLLFSAPGGDSANAAWGIWDLVLVKAFTVERTSFQQIFLFILFEISRSNYFYLMGKVGRIFLSFAAFLIGFGVSALYICLYLGLGFARLLWDFGL